MEDKVNGERKKLSLSSGGRLTLKNSIAANKSHNSIYFDFQDDQGEGVDYIAVGCTDWSENFEQTYNFSDNLRVIIANKEFDFWINNLAY